MDVVAARRRGGYHPDPMARGGRDEAGAGAQAGGSFEDVLTRLEAVAEDLETREMRLDRSLELFEEGVRLGREACRRLDEAERRVESLIEPGPDEEPTMPGTAPEP